MVCVKQYQILRNEKWVNGGKTRWCGERLMTGTPKSQPDRQLCPKQAKNLGSSCGGLPVGSRQVAEFGRPNFFGSPV